MSGDSAPDTVEATGAGAETGGEVEGGSTADPSSGDGASTDSCADSRRPSSSETKVASAGIGGILVMDKPGGGRAGEGEVGGTAATGSAGGAAGAAGGACGSSCAGSIDTSSSGVVGTEAACSPSNDPKSKSMWSLSWSSAVPHRPNFRVFGDFTGATTGAWGNGIGSVTGSGWGGIGAGFHPAALTLLPFTEGGRVSSIAGSGIGTTGAGGSQISSTTCGS
mmetsp:Transcript_21033/g.42100  ORF Transcript_21033/g.42100 Transcript_21033/m.42100 type:complete len:222 (+) Transcript_21033:1391-2056(+)